MVKLQGTSVVVILSLFLFSSQAQGKKNQCEKIRIPFCKEVGYNTTIFPNNLKHETQDEAMTRAIEFNPLVEIKCSPEIALFLCSLYAPVCTQVQTALPPCRSLCERARDGCEDLMKKFGYSWPERFQCQNFPKQGLCIGQNRTITSEQTKKLKPVKKLSVHKIRQKKCAKESHEAKLCCKLGRRAAKRGYYCNLRKKVEDNSRKAIKFRKSVVRKCSQHTLCFFSCCEVHQRKSRSNKREAKRKQ